MPNLKNYDLFISHAWKYGADYDRLERMLNSAIFFSYRNYSAPKDKPLQNLNNCDAVTKAEISAAIERKIKPVNVVLVISGMYYSHREWMQVEIDIARRLGKPIIAIVPYGATHIPVEIQKVATAVASWRTESIIDSIRRYSI